MTILSAGCGGDGTPKGPVGVGLDMDAVLEQRGGEIVAEACTIVAIEDIAEALGLEPNEIEVTDSSYPGKDRKASSCFFKWNDFDLPNSGILLQFQRNTFADEYPDYFVGVIESKKTSGESGLAPETIFFDICARLCALSPKSEYFFVISTLGEIFKLMKYRYK